MSKVENKKGKKRPFGETHFAKPGQMQENAFKKDAKKPKITTQNGDFKAENKAKSFKADKQKQHKNMKQTNYTTPPQSKEKIVTAQSKEASLKMKEKMVDSSKKKQLPKEKQQQQSPGQKSPKKELTVEQVKQRIGEIESRESLSKTATKKLYTYKKLLTKLMEGKGKSTTVTEKKNIKTNKQTNENVQLKKQKVNDKDKAKPKPVIEKHETEEDDEDDFDSDDYTDSGPSDLEEEEEKVGVEEEEEDSEEDKSYEFEEIDEEESELDEGEDESDDDEVSDEEDGEEDDEADTDDESDEITKEVAQSPTKEDFPKKGQYSLFMKNLPNDATDNDIKQHLLKTVSKVISVTKNRNFAIVELATKAEHEKGLSLDQTKFKGKIISVQQFVPRKSTSPTKRSGEPKGGKHPKDSKAPRMEFKQNKKPQQKKGKGQTNN